MFAIVLGTRPEIIKMSPIIRACERYALPYFVIHTGQHYSYGMDRIFFEELGLPEPAYHLDSGSGTHGEQTGEILEGVERVLAREKPEILLVQGDTNTVLAGALAASKCYVRRNERGGVPLPVRIGHVEAGLRSFDRAMPEEINRIVADHLADYCFAPTEDARRNLLREGIGDEKISVTGNTIVDAVRVNLSLSEKRGTLPGDPDLAEKGYLLMTLHRQENVDNRARLAAILGAVEGVQESSGLPLLFPVHPRTEKMIRSFGLPTGTIRILPPLGYLEFLRLESKARLVLTDSGGVQEEACILGVPCVTLRDSTERPETVAVGANIVAGVDPASVRKAAATMLDRPVSWENPFGDGRSGERIVSLLRDSSEG
jgi:UDP-N-acetylglucosamine 2-epimerase (non-hydrolysing)